MSRLQALCLVCRTPVGASYVIADGRVELVRSCATHGTTQTVVSTDPEFFTESLALADGAPPPKRGLIVELLDGCNVRCPTCIASSSPARRGLRDPAVIAEQFAILPEERAPLAIFLSGGEPTIHPALGQFIALTEAQPVSRRVLITNGLRLAREPDYPSVLAATMTAPWEVFLQFDSLRAGVLENIRWGDVRDVRLGALRALEEMQVATTLVCVVKRELNLDEVGELVAFAKQWKCVSGLQFQPIRAAGRLENYDAARDDCDLAAVRRQLANAGVVGLAPHPASPLAAATALYDRRTGGWQDGDKSYFVDESGPPDGRLRIAVLEYSDIGNWSSLRSDWSAIDVLQRDGSLLSVEDHFIASDTEAMAAPVPA